MQYTSNPNGTFYKNRKNNPKEPEKIQMKPEIIPKLSK
jgi:hypothetical protein